MTAITNQPNYQIAFLPWLRVAQPVSVGVVNFAAWDGFEAPDDIREHLDLLFSRYVDHDGSPVDTIAIAWVGDDPFRVRSSEEVRLVRVAVDIMILGLVGEGACDLIAGAIIGPPSADLFELVVQNFRLGNNYVGKHTDVPVLVDSTKHTFVKPLVSDVHRNLDPGQFVSAIYSRRLSRSYRNRIALAAEWYRFAFIVDQDILAVTKVVMLCTAMEILFDLASSRGKADELATKVDLLFSHPRFRRQTRLLGKSRVKHTCVGWWMFDFYKLRNNIVHTGGTGRLTRITKRQPILVAGAIIYISVLLGAGGRGVFLKSVKEHAKLWGQKTDKSSPISEYFYHSDFYGFFDEMGWITKW